MPAGEFAWARAVYTRGLRPQRRGRSSGSPSPATSLRLADRLFAHESGQRDPEDRAQLPAVVSDAEAERMSHGCGDGDLGRICPRIQRVAKCSRHSHFGPVVITSAPSPILGGVVCSWMV